MPKYKKLATDRTEKGFVIATAVLTLFAWLTLSALAGDAGDAAKKSGDKKTSTATTELATATFGSGCFWCTESDFDKVQGVVETVSGYMGGTTEKPDYRSVSSGSTGHAEVLQVKFDPKKVTYDTLLNHYWRTTDVVDGGGQFCDRGSQYRPVIFTHSDEQLKSAKDGKTALDSSKRLDKPIVVEIKSAANLPFTPAEDYHQNYYKKKPLRYKYYRYACGRDARLKQLWGETVTH